MSRWEEWSLEESAVLRKHYWNKGPVAVAAMLPKRTIAAVERRALRLNLRTQMKRQRIGRLLQERDEEWKRLIEDIPQDTRTPGQRLMGEPIFERSALFKKQMEAR